jgi:membrane-associated protease RseP (regulator of RpoE activity)
METSSFPADVPTPDRFADAFHVYEVNVEGDEVRYYGEPLAPQDAVVQQLAPVFRERGYRVRVERQLGEHVLVATERSPGIDGVPWTNVGLFVATLATTLLAGAGWYGIPVTQEPLRAVEAWPFAASVLGVLAIHELGHYVMSRYHDVEATLPYFIPVPTLLGTLGAVIRMNDHIPSRRALFDIGVAGPLAGLVATVVVTAIGVSLPPIETGAMVGGSTVATTAATQVELGYPPLIQLVAWGVGQPLSYAQPGLMVNPVVVGGWVGAFVTFLNLLPVGQLDGAHVTRALVGDALSAVQRLVPLALFGLAGYLYVFEDGRAVGIWVLWGLLALVFGRVSGVTPLDESPVGHGRWFLGLVTLVLGVLSFTPIPIVVGA